MKPVTKILHRVIGVPFYQRNAGLFLFLFILLFGVVHGSELWFYHLSLVYAMLDSSLFMVIVAAIWLLYNLKCVQFTTRSFSEPKHSFLSVIACLSKSEQLISLFRMQLFLFLPVLLYSVFVIGVAIYSESYLHAAFVIIYDLLLCFWSALIYRQKIDHPDSGKSLYAIPFLKFRFPKNYPMIFISYLLNDLKIVFLVTKFFSAIVLIAFLNGFFINVADSRIPFLAMLIGLIAHSVIVFEFRKFEETQLSFSRNLPVPLWKRFCWIVAVYLMILIPEWIILGTSIPKIISLADFINLVAFGVSVLMVFHCLLYWLKRDTEVFLKYVFGTFAILFFLILYKAYILILSIMLITSLVIFFQRYFLYENIISDE